MKPSLEPVRFSTPLRNVRFTAPLSFEERERELRKREEEAFQRGRREGEKSLSEQLVQQRAELLELQNGVFQSLCQILPGLVQDCERSLVSLALEAAQKVVSGLPITAEVVEAAVREALGTVDKAAGMTVFLNAQDLELLRRVNSPLLLDDSAGKDLRVQASAEVTRGGCIVQTRFGIVDARRENKLELLRNSLSD
jgi:flagellar assembly protein FliH